MLLFFFSRKTKVGIVVFQYRVVANNDVECSRVQYCTSMHNTPSRKTVPANDIANVRISAAGRGGVHVEELRQIQVTGEKQISIMNRRNEKYRGRWGSTDVGRARRVRYAKYFSFSNSCNIRSYPGVVIHERGG